LSVSIRQSFILHRPSSIITIEVIGRFHQTSILIRKSPRSRQGGRCRSLSGSPGSWMTAFPRGEPTLFCVSTLPTRTTTQRDYLSQRFHSSLTASFHLFPSVESWFLISLVLPSKPRYNNRDTNIQPVRLSSHPTDPPVITIRSEREDSHRSRLEETFVAHYRLNYHRSNRRPSPDGAVVCIDAHGP
jgi:hypothetical protein